MASESPVPVAPGAAGARGGRAGRGALAAYALAIVYASLNPFFGWRAPEAFTLFTWPRYLNAFDIVLNVLAYIPFGAMIAGFRLRAHRREESAPWHAWTWATLAGLLLSALMETLQAFLPVRVSSPLDLMTNASGAAIGAGLVVSVWGRALLARLQAWRHRHFASRDETGWGLLLAGAWFFAQLNPVIPFFEAGSILGPAEPATSPTAWDTLVLLPQAVGITLNVCGFALFVSLLLRSRRANFLNVLLVVALGLIAKVSAAGLMLKAPQLVGWLGPATVIGLTSGLILFAYFSRVHYRWRAFWTTLFIFAGGLMVKMTGAYGAFDETMRLFNWPQGHVASFAGMTRWVHEVWPLPACLLAAWIFVKRRGSH